MQIHMNFDQVTTSVSKSEAESVVGLRRVNGSRLGKQVLYGNNPMSNSMVIGPVTYLTFEDGKYILTSFDKHNNQLMTVLNQSEFNLLKKFRPQ